MTHAIIDKNITSIGTYAFSSWAVADETNGNKVFDVNVTRIHPKIFTWTVATTTVVHKIEKKKDDGVNLFLVTTPNKEFNLLIFLLMICFVISRVFRSISCFFVFWLWILLCHYRIFCGHQETVAMAVHSVTRFHFTFQFSILRLQREEQQF